MNHTFVQSIKTIAESLIKKAGFDKTRSGKIVGKNEITNTYSVKITRILLADGGSSDDYKYYK